MSVGQAVLGQLNEAPRFTTVLHVNARSEFEQTELQICAENQRTDVIVTAPLAIHNTVCNKNLETICAKCHTLAQKQSRLKKYATGFVLFASLAFCAVMAATVLPVATKQQDENQTPDHCYHDGNQYSVGSIEKMKNGEYRECVQSVNAPSKWLAISRDKVR